MKKLFLLVFWLNACSYSKPLELKDFDFKAFKSDRGACEGKRTLQIEYLKNNKDKILSISENEVIKAFGRYDYQGLGKKNEKTFVYFLEKGPHCDQIQNSTQALSMIVHFNSVGLAKEILFEKGGIAE
jgi:hypothetical protein